MKPSIALAAVTAVAAATVALWPESSPETLTQQPENLHATTDAEAVFKRAFWRRPAADDHIANASLAEWTDDGNQVSRWQWFIEVEPSPALRSDLLEKNPFGLVSTPEANLPPATTTPPPAWFPANTDSFDLHRTPDGRMTLLVDRTRNAIFATASGQGFAAGAAEPPPAATSPQTAGRLPLTPPPSPPE